MASAYRGLAPSMVSMISEPAGAKRALRAELRERRRIRPSAERDAASVDLTRQLIALTSALGPRSLACYLSTPDEPETRPFLAWTAAVDRTGMRMGWGRGYFDKTLGSMDRRPPVFAVLFDDELVDELPREKHDQPVDGVVTPGGIQRF